ncbi:MAG: 4Fe-4S dicluster domain-containing protein [Oscillospiraceae bacterium]|nr:4Fe-4S dicluster domain-containing protein [Oscillospiraceae bacterium]
MDLPVLKPFKGVRLPMNQHAAFARPLMKMTLPETLSVPLFDFGAGPMLPVIRVGETVAKNAILARSKNGAQWTVAPASGKLTSIERVELPFVGKVACANIKTGEKIPELPPVPRNPANMNSQAVITAARQACIIDELDGMPLYHKLAKAKHDGLRHIVADCLDDSPWVSSALKTVSDFGDLCADGVGFVLKVLEGGQAVLAVYDPGDLNIDPILANFGFIKTVRVTGGYPSWPRFEKAFCEEPYVRVGVGALRALSMAVRQGLPQSDTVITVSGDCVRSPVNLVVPIGTTVNSIFSETGLKNEPRHILIGDTMKGAEITNRNIPVFPGVRAITAMSEISAAKNDPCISCGACAEACPQGLFPAQAHRMVTKGGRRVAAKFGAEKCDLCGACSAVCPSLIDLAEEMAELNKID